jgi:uncharacterized protein YlxW (UPF0749 family)
MTKPRMLVGLLFVAMGVWLGVAARQTLLLQSSLSYRRFVAMAALLEAEATRREALLSRLEALRHLSPPRTASLGPLELRLARARRQAGETWVRGPGVVVTLSDAPLPSSPVTDVNDYLIHDIDLLALVNQLNEAGARAVAINGQRVVATTAIHCAGPVITINGVPTAPPVEVVAEGPPNRLRRAALEPGGIVSRLRLYGFPVAVAERTVAVPPFRPRHPPPRVSIGGPGTP